VFGGSSETIAGAVSILTTHPVDMIDINMGCPVAKVLKSGGGAVLMRDVGLAREIIQAAVETSDIPVTIKMRAGWDADSINAPELAAIAQDSGAAAVAVHPRIKTQGFTGHADWTLIAEIKKQLNIPVIGSGDVRSPDDAKRMREETGCNFVMIGRAARGNPWIFRRTTTLLHEGVLLPEPSPVERLRVLRSHCALLAKLEGDLRTARKMRKHAAWYIKGLKNAAIARQKVNRAESVNEIMEVCRLLEEEWHEACK
jgi:nifR3 family TIM-barrel protein